MRYGVVCLCVLACFLMSSCASSWRWEEKRGVHIESPRIIKPLESPLFGEYAGILVLPLLSKNCPASWQEKFARFYANSLIERRVFAETRFFPVHNLQIEDALAVARREGKDFLLYGRVDRLLATGGGQPQGVRIEIWILGVKNGNTRFHVLQEGYSTPGKDIDLYWKTYTGRPGAGVEFIVRELADQFADVVADSEREARKKMKGSSD
ncbi:hypothetical protein [Thermodesulforhabdus norvegica]|uniref:Lipoprotein n=1 Tax=Thermodesulforhabdus norvegica TaxID=39841 RepID=A0A1I4QT84_9BACT|nr:hypothetical protein [Thermodesulforhabdus norvegica]SFM42916.1 hypothetical protein SAMN05660836_00198 [Thermodesulforhabdus norvegica]